MTKQDFLAHSSWAIEQVQMMLDEYPNKERLDMGNFDDRMQLKLHRVLTELKFIKQDYEILP